MVPGIRKFTMILFRTVDGRLCQTTKNGTCLHLSCKRTVLYCTGTTKTYLHEYQHEQNPKPSGEFQVLVL
jgi:hypothetical protein